MGSKGYINKAKSGAVAATARRLREAWKARREDRWKTRPVKSNPKKRIEVERDEKGAKTPGHS
jgi:hypothetical protein